MMDTNNSKLLTTGNLADMLGIQKFHVQRAISENVFPYIETVSGTRCVPDDDEPTLMTLRSAAVLFKTYKIPFAKAIRIIQSGLVTT